MTRTPTPAEHRAAQLRLVALALRMGLLARGGDAPELGHGVIAALAHEIARCGGEPGAKAREGISRQIVGGWWGGTRLLRADRRLPGE